MELEPPREVKLGRVLCGEDETGVAMIVCVGSGGSLLR